jgi:hypothetical protein
MGTSKHVIVHCGIHTVKFDRMLYVAEETTDHGCQMKDMGRLNTVEETTR